MITRLTLFLLLVLLVLPASAQDVTGITDDDVNAVAEQLYCPVCENIPLDVCGTQACADWREEIRVQLEQGQTSQQIIDAFVARYGERVIGTPQDPTLRTLSLLTPWIIGLVAVIAALLTFFRWRATRTQFASALDSVSHVTLSDTDYRARLERDLRERR